ncbi:MAG: DNA-formamidopyrimidine glycosylase family protein [Lacisediminihabitans sp.]
MPEGDTVWLAARNLNAALSGQILAGFDLRVTKFATEDLTGERVNDVVSRGKHLLMHIGDYTLHSHLKMEGSWHLYRPGTPWRRPAFEARAVLETAEWQAVGFALGITELVRRDSEESVVGRLGPDLLGSDWDATRAASRLLTDPTVPIFVALQDQRNLAGIGNEYANELCFLRGLAPSRVIGEVSDVNGTVALAHRLLRANCERPIRSTTGDLRPGRTSWVYGRAGKPCRRCGTSIAHGMLGPTPLIQRDAYWCPRCQS